MIIKSIRIVILLFLYVYPIIVAEIQGTSIHASSITACGRKGKEDADSKDEHEETIDHNVPRSKSEVKVILWSGGNSEIMLINRGRL